MYDREYDPRDFEEPSEVEDKATFAKFPLLHQTDRAYLLEGKRGNFWIPKALVWDSTIDVTYIGDEETKILKGYFVKDFKPNYIKPVADIFEDLDDA